MIQYSESVQRVPGIAPADITSTTTYSDVVNVGKTHWVSFVLALGAITGDTAVVTVQECTAADATGAQAVEFDYRLSSAVGTDSMGATTAATDSGVTLAATDDNKVLIVDVNPDTLTDGYPFVRLSVDPGASMTAFLVSCVIDVYPRYGGASSTDLVA